LAAAKPITTMKDHTLRRRIVLAVTTDRSLRLLKGQPAYLSDLGWDVHLISNGDSGRDPQVELGPSPSVTFHRIPMERDPSIVADFVSMWRWFRLLRSLKPDVVCVGTPKAAMLGIWSSWLAMVPTRIYLIRGLRYETIKSPLVRQIFIAVERVTGRLATHVISVSASMGRVALEAGIGRRTGIDVIGAGSSNGVTILPDEDVARLKADREALLREMGLAHELATIGWVGRLTPDKGTTQLVRACQLLVQREVPFQLLMLGREDFEGSGHLEELRIMLQSAGVRYAHHDHVTDPERLMAQLDVLCLPSFREGLPNVPLEAAALGIPVVTSDATGCVDAVVHGQTGLIVPRSDVEALADALEALVTDSEMCREFGAAGRAWVMENFERRAVWRLYADYYAQAAEQALTICATGPKQRDETIRSLELPSTKGKDTS